MKTRTLAAIGAAGLAAATFASPAMAGSAPGTGFAGSSHDATSRQGTNITSGACAECHTPHQAKTTNLLWNHTLSSSTFSWAGATATTAGTTYATFSGQTYAGMSAKCLSCHDGTVATASGEWFNGSLQPVGTSFIGQGHLTSPWSVIGGYNQGAATDSRPASGQGANGGGHMEGTHPLAMPYPYMQARNTYNNTTTGSGYVPTDWVSDPTANGIRLYNNPDGVGTNISAGVMPGFTGMECGSCHDVHNGSTVQDLYFVRGKLAGNSVGNSYICAKCHAK
ncbi:MAG TPA: hypothetical protein VL742_21380 [Casimicrobiaceae bacterium]|nr:hypothetical protein [Casimicrobiaceae bacterium]